MQNWCLPTVWVIAVGTWVTSGVGPVHAQVPPPAGGWAPATATANSSDLSRGAQDGTGQGTLSLSAVLSDEGQPIERGLASSWPRGYAGPKDAVNFREPTNRTTAGGGEGGRRSHHHCDFRA